MFTKKYFTVFTAAMVLLVLIGFAGRSALAGETTAPVRLEARIAAGVRLESVSISADHSLSIVGTAAEMAGACLPVHIFVDGEREPWWPVFRCLQVAQDGGWSLRLPSDGGGEPIGVHIQVGE